MSEYCFQTLSSHNLNFFTINWTNPAHKSVAAVWADFNTNNEYSTTVIMINFIVSIVKIVLLVSNWTSSLLYQHRQHTAWIISLAYFNCLFHGLSAETVFDIFYPALNNENTCKQQRQVGLRKKKDPLNSSVSKLQLAPTIALHFQIQKYFIPYEFW